MTETEIRTPRSPGRAAQAAEAVAALLGGSAHWDDADYLLEDIADILARHGYTHPGNVTPDEQEAYALLAAAHGLEV